MRPRTALTIAWFALAALTTPAFVLAQADAPDEAAPPAETTPAETTPEEPAPPDEQDASPPAAKPAPAPAKPKAAAAPAPAQPEPAAAPIAFPAASGSVTIADFSFQPASITVNVGDAVTWRNADSTAHTATASDGSFDTGLLKQGASGSHTFDEAGSFSYVCTPHPNMKGTVTVKAADSGGGGGGSSDDSGGGGGSSDGAPSTAAGTQQDAATGDDSAATGPQLPASGADAGVLGLVGLGLLGVGLALRRRTEQA